MNERAAKNSASPALRLRRYAPAVLICGAGAALSVWLFAAARNNERQHEEMEFRRAAEDRASAINYCVQSNMKVVESVGAFYAASDFVDPAQFHKFTVRLLQQVPGTQALEWIPRVRQAQRQEIEEAARLWNFEEPAQREGFARFTIKERHAQGHMIRAGEREEYYPVYYVEPHRGNETAVGFDLASDRTRLEALTQSRDTGKTLATARMTLVQETRGQYGFLVFLPVYARGAPADSLESRRANLRGFVLGVFRVGDILKKALSYLEPQEIDLHVFDQSAPEEEGFLCSYSSETREVYNRPIRPPAYLLAEIHHTAALNVAGRQWQIVCTPTSQFMVAGRTWYPWGILVFGLASTGLLTAYLLAGVNRARHIEHLVRERTSQRAEAYAQLEREAAQRKQAEAALQKACDELERRVAQRTGDLEASRTAALNMMEDTQEARERAERANGALRAEITERKRVEEALRASENRYKTLVENIPQKIFLKDRNSVYVSCNQPYACDVGIKPDEIADKTDYDFHPRELADKYRSDDKRIMAGGKTEDIEERYIQGGEERFVHTVKTPVRDEQGSVVGVLGIFWDITEHRRAEEALRESREKFQSILENVGIGISLISPKMEVLELNRQMRQWFPKVNVAEHPSCFCVFNDPPRAVPCSYCPLVKTLRDGRVHEVVTETPAGKEIRTYRVISSPIRNAAGEIVAAIEMVEDITDRKALETQLLHAQKMEAIGRLAGGVAHDFNNLLTGISGYTELLLAQAKAGSEFERDLKQVRDLSHRAAVLTQQLLAFSRRQPMQMTVLNINEFMRRTTGVLQRLIGEDIALQFIPAPDLGNVRADPTQLEQVLMNLVVNARDAMPKGGKLTIKTANTLLDNGYADRHHEIKPGPYVSVTINDTGCGMDKATRQRLFEPFFTTKERGKGTGLGLATVFGIIKQHGGHISVYSELGTGTSFKIYLPRVDVKAEAPAAPPEKGVSPCGSETVLLVEDEVEVRAVVRRTLEQQGYGVLVAASPAEAEEAFAQHAGEVALLLTDVVMPGESGQDLYARLKTIRPSLKVLCMSGYSDSVIVRNGMLEPGIAFIQKPFSPDALARKVRAVLDDGRPSGNPPDSPPRQEREGDQK